MVMLEAVKKYYEAVILECRVNIQIYMVNSIGIGDHGNIVDTVKGLIEKLSEAEDRLGTTNRLIEEISASMSNNANP